MVKNSIKVYARLKKEFIIKQVTKYDVSKNSEHEDLIFTLDGDSSISSGKAHKYRFTQIFDQISSQEEIFNIVARPVINSVFNGFNGTIFAYGQTGSGKTYTITGSPNKYEDRGILPRCIEQIFEYLKKTSTQYSIFVSYLEIYNEIGYDLLNSKHQPSSLEELPRVALLEDANGEAHLRNLSILPVNNEQEAMRLLFLGDTNRTIAETPMNEYSSRSHCIFTIYVNISSEKAEKLRRSKLHLVDLAGSERIHKSKITGITLNEAKHINLSLHYLEQVIIALSESHRSHIPYRNSMMTYILRDSIAGNSLTAMLATLALTRKNIRETLSTCKFAQRVACISTEATINEEIDPQKEILFLRKEVDELRRQFIQVKGINNNETLTPEQMEKCKKVINDYSMGLIELPIDLNPHEMRFCLKVMKKTFNSKQRKQEKNVEDSNGVLVLKYNELITQKDEEITILRELLDATSKHTVSNKYKTDNEYSKSKITFSEQEQFERYKRQNGKDIEEMKVILKKKYELAKNFPLTIQKCQDNISSIRSKLYCKTNTSEMNQKLRSFLLSQQNVYRDSLRQLENLKCETDFLEEGVKQAENRILIKFKQQTDAKVQNNSTYSRTSSGYSSSSLNTENFGVLPDNFCFNEKPEMLDSCDKYFNNIYQRKLPEHKSGTLPGSISLAHSPDLNYVYQQPFGNLADSCKETSNYQADRDNDYDGFDQLQEKYFDTSEELFSSKLFKSSEKLENFSYFKNLTNISPVSSNEYRSSTTVENNKKPVGYSNENTNNIFALKKEGDSKDFLEFMETVPLTGDIEVDEEIFNFYRSKFLKK